MPACDSKDISDSNDSTDSNEKYDINDALVLSMWTPFSAQATIGVGDLSST